jgi:flavin-dependent dehydrogenase
MDRRRVLVVGGGIAGLALAPILARTGVAVELIERAPAWQPAGTGTYLPGNAAGALRALGPEPQGSFRAIEIQRRRFCNNHGSVLCDVDVAELWAGVGPCLALYRADLHAVLREAAGEVPPRDLAEHGPRRCDGARGRPRAQTHRRDQTRYLPPAIRDNVLRLLGQRTFHANYRPLLAQP